MSPLNFLYDISYRNIISLIKRVNYVIISTGITFLRILSPFYFVVSLKLVSDGVLRGAGMMKKFMIATFTDLILRVVLAKALSIPFASTGIWLAWPIGWIIATVMSVIFCNAGCWKNKNHYN